jgi:hypothetical protein
MFRTPHLAAGLATFLLAVAVAPICVADMEQQVAQLEQLSAQWDKLNNSASEYAAVLESVKDSASAGAAVGLLEAKAKEFVAATEATVPLLNAAIKFRPSPAAMAPYQERLEAIKQRQPAQTEEWSKQSLRYAAETKRVDDMKGLPSAFWDVFNVQNVRLGLATDGILRATGGSMPPILIRFMTDKLALYEKHGPSKVVDIGLEGGTPADRNSAEKAISKALPGVKLIRLAGATGQVLTIAPVEKLSDITAALKTDMPVVVDEGRRRVIVKMGPVEDGSSGGIATIGAGRRPASPQQSDDDSADANSISDLGPDWPELEASDDPQAVTKLEFLQRIGRDKVTFVEVTNVPADFNARHTMRSVLREVCPGVKYVRGSGPHYMVGPVEDFTAFCTALTWATIDERDDARQIVKITMDLQKLEKARGVVHVEVVNYEELKREQAAQYQAKEKARAEAYAAAKAANPNGRRNFREDSGHDHARFSDDWRSNLGILLNHAAKPSGHNAGGTGSKLEILGVANLDEFCKKLDFLEITEKDEATSTLKIKVDPQKLTKDAVLKRIDPSQLEWHERSQLGLEDDGPRGRLRESAAAAAEKRKQEQAEREAETRERHELIERMQADAAAGREPNPADLAALKNIGAPKAGSESPSASPSESTPSSAQAGSPAAPVADANPVRKWSDRTGKFNVTAKLIKQNGDRVVLEKVDGKTIEVPIAKLSDEDAKYLRGLDENPF